MRSFTSVAAVVPVTVLCTVELLIADVVFVNTTPLLIVFGVVNTTEVAVMFSGIC